MRFMAILIVTLTIFYQPINSCPPIYDSNSRYLVDSKCKTKFSFAVDELIRLYDAGEVESIYQLLDDLAEDCTVNKNYILIKLFSSIGHKQYDLLSSLDLYRNLGSMNKGNRSYIFSPLKQLNAQEIEQTIQNAILFYIDPSKYNKNMLVDILQLQSHPYTYPTDSTLQGALLQIVLDIINKSEKKDKELLLSLIYLGDKEKAFEIIKSDVYNGTKLQRALNHRVSIMYSNYFENSNHIMFGIGYRSILHGNDHQMIGGHPEYTLAIGAKRGRVQYDFYSSYRDGKDNNDYSFFVGGEISKQLTQMDKFKIDGIAGMGYRYENYQSKELTRNHALVLDCGISVKRMYGKYEDKYISLATRYSFSNYLDSITSNNYNGTLLVSFSIGYYPKEKFKREQYYLLK